jgi:urease accessory protein UreF
LTSADRAPHHPGKNAGQAVTGVRIIVTKPQSRVLSSVHAVQQRISQNSAPHSHIGVTVFAAHLGPDATSAVIRFVNHPLHYNLVDAAIRAGIEATGAAR